MTITSCQHCAHHAYCSHCPAIVEGEKCYPYQARIVKPGCDKCHKSSDKKYGSISAKCKELEQTCNKQAAKLAFLKESVGCEPSCETSEGDVAITVTKGYNRFILSDKSPVFRKMLESEMQETKTGVIRIRDTTLPVLRAVIKFCYTADITFSEDVSPLEVLKIGDKYDIAYLREVCGEEFVMNLTIENLPRMVNLASRFDVKCLRDAASKLVKENFDLAFPVVVRALLDNLT